MGSCFETEWNPIFGIHIGYQISEERKRSSANSGMSCPLSNRKCSSCLQDPVVSPGPTCAQSKFLDAARRCVRVMQVGGGEHDAHFTKKRLERGRAVRQSRKLDAVP